MKTVLLNLGRLMKIDRSLTILDWMPLSASAIQHQTCSSSSCLYGTHTNTQSNTKQHRNEDIYIALQYM